MPSSSFIVNSEFQPMSYQELLHPVLTQTQYQRELDEKYTQLDLQADKLEQLANSAVDQASYEKYKSFANRLREEAGNLARYGLRGRDNARFMELFRSYGKEIQPLLDAQTKRERLIAMQQQLSMQDPTSLYDRSAGNISLEELMANPSAAPVRQSGELLRAQASAMATNLQNELRQATFSKTATPGYLAFTQKYGLSSADVAAFVSNPNSPNANKVLRAIYDQVMTSSGVKENWEGDAYNRAAQYVGMGLWNAIGKSAVQPLTDNVYMANLNFAHQKALQDRAHRQAMARQRQAQSVAQQMAKGALPFNVTGTYDKKKIDENNKKMDYYRKRGYFDVNRDGSLRITDRGMLALFDRLKKSKSISGVSGPDLRKPGIQSTSLSKFDGGFYNFMKSTGMLNTGARTVGTKTNGSKAVNKLVTDRATLSKNINKFFTANQLGFDLNYTPQVVQQLGSAAKPMLQDVVTRGLTEKDYKKMDTDAENLLGGTASSLIARGDKVFMPVIGKDGKKYEVPINKEYNPAIYDNVISGVQQMTNIGNVLRDAKKSGRIPKEYNADGTVKEWYNVPASSSDLENFNIMTRMGLMQNLVPEQVRNMANFYTPVSNKPISLDYLDPTAGYGTIAPDEDLLQQLIENQSDFE